MQKLHCAKKRNFTYAINFTVRKHNFTLFKTITSLFGSIYG